MLTRLLLPLILILASCTTPQAQTPSASVGAVSAADPRATAAGMEILRGGGSAADGAIAVMLALTVVEPQSSGIGGGGFLVYHDEARDRLSTYDGRERAPDAAGPNLFTGANGQPMGIREAVAGGRSVGVPGNLRLAELAHRRHGRLPWAQLFAPAIRLARDGFQITPRLHRALAAEGSLGRFSPGGRALFYQANGEPHPIGTQVRNPELARLLEKIAARGPDYFYVGPAAQELVRTVRSHANAGQMSEGDLASYSATDRPAQCGRYRGYRICGMGPPSSGATTVFAILEQLERFDLRALGPNNPRAWHLIGESMRLAYADREAYLADPDFFAVPTAGLMNERYLAERSRLISPDRRMERVTAGTPPGARRVTAAADGEVPSTSHFVVVDRAGNVSSYTSTIEAAFGSGLTANGMFLNNELTDFSFAPEQNGAPVANRVEGGKRPRSSMSPTIVFGPDGELRLAIGAAGGPTIIVQVAKAIIGVVDWNLTAQQAIALPTMFVRGDTLAVERGTFLEAMIPALQAYGHRVAPMDPGFKANAVERVNGRLAGAADPRSEGVALVE
jgi:gamma-glutamyltranspeptidase/glutathione hydrolase